MPPPIESVYSLMNAFMTKDKGKKNKKKLLVSWGMAETMSWAKRKRICLWNIVEPPPEDEHLPGDTEPMPGS